MDKKKKGEKEGGRERARKNSQRCYLMFVWRLGRKYRILKVRREGIKIQTKEKNEKAIGNLKYHHGKSYKEKGDHWVKCSKEDKQEHHWKYQ